MLDVLVVAPHPDDAELGMGGALLKFKADGLSVGVLDLTNGEPTPLGSPEIRARETAAATEILGLDWRKGSARSRPGRSPVQQRAAKRYALKSGHTASTRVCGDTSQQWIARLPGA